MEWQLAMQNLFKDIRSLRKYQAILERINKLER